MPQKALYLTTNKKIPICRQIFAFSGFMNLHYFFSETDRDVFLCDGVLSKSLLGRESFPNDCMKMVNSIVIQEDTIFVFPDIVA